MELVITLRSLRETLDDHVQICTYELVACARVYMCTYELVACARMQMCTYERVRVNV